MTAVPEKPSLDGLEDKWAAHWDAEGTYRFDRSRTRERRLLDRHAAAHGERLAARRPRVLLHPHRHHRPLPAHARPRGLLPDGVGRQRRAHRAPGAELLRRALRPHAAYDPDFTPPEKPGKQEIPISPAELRGAVRPPRRRRRAEVRGAVAHARPLGRLVDDLHHHRHAGPARVAARVPAHAGARRGLPVGGAHAVGRRLPHGRVAGRARRPRARRRVPLAALRRHRRPGRPRHRDHPARAAPRVRRAGRAPRRRALPAALRARRSPRRCSACRCRCSRTRSPIPRRAPASR